MDSNPFEGWTVAERADLVMSLFAQHGHEAYIGEPVSQLEHAVQCAQLAAANGADDATILAALLHDIGHLLEHFSNGKMLAQMDGFGLENHDALGAEFIRQIGLGEKVAALAGSHVQAKRYLTAVDAGYYARLSDASRQTLRFQGGPMREDEVAAFEADPLHEAYTRLRLWDEAAKQTDLPLPDNLDIYRQMIINQLNKE